MGCVGKHAWRRRQLHLVRQSSLSEYCHWVFFESPAAFLPRGFFFRCRDHGRLSIDRHCNLLCKLARRCRLRCDRDGGNLLRLGRLVADQPVTRNVLSKSGRMDFDLFASPIISSACRCGNAIRIWSNARPAHPRSPACAACLAAARPLTSHWTQWRAGTRLAQRRTEEVRPEISVGRETFDTFRARHGHERAAPLKKDRAHYQPWFPEAVRKCFPMPMVHRS